MKTKLFLILFLSCVFLFSSCSDDVNEIKNPNGYGGLLSAMVDDEIISFSSNVISMDNGFFSLYTVEDDKKHSYDYIFRFNISVGVAETTYEMGNLATPGTIVQMAYREQKDNPVYYSKSTPSGKLIIEEIDEVNKTMSGTFSATVVNEVTEEEIVITGGVFTAVPYITGEADLGTMYVAKKYGQDLKMFKSLISYSSQSWGVYLYNEDHIMTIDFPVDMEIKTYTASELYGPSIYFRYVEGLYTYVPKTGTLNVIINNETTGEFKATFDIDFQSRPLNGPGPSMTEGVLWFNYKTDEMF